MIYTLPMHKLQLSEITAHFYVDIKINRFKAKMLLDTGASQTLISEKFANKLKIEKKEIETDNISIGIANNKLSPQLAEIQLLQIDNIKIRGFQCIVLPMEHINNTYRSIGQNEIDGIIGNELLIYFKSIIHLKKNTLILHSNQTDFNFVEI